MQSPGHHNVINASIPITADGEYETCDVITESGVVQCSSWVYDQSVFEESLVSELDIVCDNTLFKQHSTMVMFAGKMLGALSVGVLADRLGRRPVLLTLIVILAVGCVGNALVESMATLFIFRFLTGVSTTGSIIVARVIAMEYVQPAVRSKVPFLSGFGKVTGALSLAPIAYTMRNWQDIQLIILWPLPIVVILPWLIPESARWLVARGRYDAAQSAMEKAAKLNGRKIDSDAVTSLKAEQAVASANPLELFKSARLALRWSTIYFNRFVISMVFYGLTLNLSNLYGDIFLNYTFSTLADMAGDLISIFVVEHVSRKYFHMTVMLVSGGACILTFVPALAGADGWPVLLLSLLGKLFISMAFFLISVYTAELFPTSHRGFGVATTSMFGQLGGIASPYVADLNLYIPGQFGQIMPQLVFGAAGVCAGVLTLILPETRNTKLPEDIEDAENFGKQQTRG